MRERRVYNKVKSFDWYIEREEERREKARESEGTSSKIMKNSHIVIFTSSNHINPKYFFQIYGPKIGSKCLGTEIRPRIINLNVFIKKMFQINEMKTHF